MVDEIPAFPVWSIVATVATAALIVASILLNLLPPEPLIAVGASLIVVFLSQTVQQAVTWSGKRRHFRFALWELTNELRGHLQLMPEQTDLVRERTKTGQDSNAGNQNFGHAALPVEFPSEAWQRFLGIGGLRYLARVAPLQVASNVWDYYDEVNQFNKAVEKRYGLLVKMLDASPPSFASILRTVNATEEGLEDLLRGAKTDLVTSMAEIQFVLGDRGPVPITLLSKEKNDRRIDDVIARERLRYERWRMRHGDTAEPARTVEAIPTSEVPDADRQPNR
jgi:hypothetical protein